MPSLVAPPILRMALPHREAAPFLTEDIDGTLSCLDGFLCVIVLEDDCAYAVCEAAAGGRGGLLTVDLLSLGGGPVNLVLVHHTGNKGKWRVRRIW